MKWKIVVIKKGIKIKLVIQEGFLNDNPSLILESIERIK